MSDKPSQLFIAKTASFPGYWGSSADGVHHAIASCCDEGAARDGVFVVYDAYEGCSMGEMGGIRYLSEHGEPEVEGVYDAAGNRLGDDLADAAEAMRTGWAWDITSCALSKESIEQLKKHK